MNACRYAALLGATLFNYAVSITGVVLLYVYFTHVSNLSAVNVSRYSIRCYYFIHFQSQVNSCGLNKFFISFNLILCVIASVVSTLPTIQEYNPRSGILQSSVVTLYVVYLTWSGMSNSPGMCYILNTCKLFLYLHYKFLNTYYRQRMQSRIFPNNFWQ